MKALRYIIIMLFFTTIYSGSATLKAQPKMVVNIVVSSLHADDLNRYEKNFSEGGFRRLMQQGACFTNASYDYMQTTTPVSLATISFPKIS